MAVYQPLAAYLTAHPAQQLTCTFAQIEQLLGRKLPRSARVHRAWWASDRYHVQGKAWLKVGWRVVCVDLATETVTFSRVRR